MSEEREGPSHEQQGQTQRSAPKVVVRDTSCLGGKAIGLHCVVVPSSFVAGVLWVLFITPDSTGIHGEPEFTEFPIFGREITLEDFP